MSRSLYLEDVDRADEKEITGAAARLVELGLGELDICRATGSDRDEVHEWLSGRSAPQGEKAERLLELAVLVARLRTLIGADLVSAWLNGPVPALDERRPIELVAEGNCQDVAALLSALEGMTAS